MRQQVEGKDWSATPLGAREQWCPELRTTVEQVLDSGFAQAIVWGPDFTTIYNDAFRKILGKKVDCLGKSFASIWAEAWDTIGPIADKAYSGESTYIEDFPLVIDRTGRSEKAYFTFCYSPLRLADGTVAGMLDTVVETTATVDDRGELALANGELAHRLKNTFTMVQAIATQTFRECRDLPELGAFQQRLAALARANDALLRHNWGSISLHRMIADNLLEHGAKAQIALSGPDVTVGPHSATAVTMILHELATNATKYGALSHAGGTVAITSRNDADGQIAIEWRERGGPKVHAAPSRRGFGSRLVERGLGYGSEVERDFAPEGLTVTLRAHPNEWAH